MLRSRAIRVWPIPSVCTSSRICRLLLALRGDDMKRPMTSGSAIPSMNRAVGQKERLRLELWLSNDASRLNLPPYVDVLGLTLSFY